MEDTVLRAVVLRDAPPTTLPAATVEVLLGERLRNDIPVRSQAELVLRQWRELQNLFVGVPLKCVW